MGRQAQQLLGGGAARAVEALEVEFDPGACVELGGHGVEECHTLLLGGVVAGGRYVGRRPACERGEEGPRVQAAASVATTFDSWEMW